jgi:hypothetical protein
MPYAKVDTERAKDASLSATRHEQKSQIWHIRARNWYKTGHYPEAMAAGGKYIEHQRLAADAVVLSWFHSEGGVYERNLNRYLAGATP